MAGRSWMRKLAFGLFTTVVLLGVTELVLRITTAQVGRASIPAHTVAAHVQSEGLRYDETYGWVRQHLPDPGHHIDEHGFRRMEPTRRTKPRGTWRAFTMGDSQTYGAGVEADQTYSAYAEAALAAAVPDRRVEIINTGLSGYGSLQALRLIQHKLLDWDPDLLIVDCRAYDQPRDGLTPRGQLSTIQRLLFGYRTYYVLRFAVERYRGNVRPMEVPTDGGDIPGGGNHDVIIQTAQAAGVPVVFLDYPFWGGMRGHQSQPITCLAEPEDLPEEAVMVRICHGLRASGEHPSTLFLDNNHMTARGNEVAGQALAAGLIELGLGP